MKRSELTRRTPLKANPDTTRAFRDRAQRKVNTTTKRRPISPASLEQRLKVRDQSCIVCGSSAKCDPAHLIDRSLCGQGADDALAVIALDRPCHTAYDNGALDLLPYEAKFREELVFAVYRFGLLATLQRVTGCRWQPATPNPEGSA